jgi:hypothetical protein
MWERYLGFLSLCRLPQAYIYLGQVIKISLTDKIVGNCGRHLIAPSVLGRWDGSVAK